MEYSIILILYYSIEQMVGCKSRGYLFTRAHLGLCSDELHVCGDPAVVPLIQRILEDTGEAEREIEAGLSVWREIATSIHSVRAGARTVPVRETIIQSGQSKLLAWRWYRGIAKRAPVLERAMRDESAEV